MSYRSIHCIAAALLVAASSAFADSNDSQGAGWRYEGVQGSANAVWVVDRKTGKVRKCTQEFADQPPECTPYSN